jgi:RNA polymerase sigma-70 factor (ECF subfamily)
VNKNPPLTFAHQSSAKFKNQPMKKLLTILGICLLIGVAWAQVAKEISLKTLAPSVIKTVPQAGDDLVDPNLKEITVTFSKDMMTNKMWAVVQVSKDNFPPSAGQIHYMSDGRTCVVPVKLEPGKTYVVWFNRGQYNSFRDTDNNPAVPYQLAFATKK